MPSARYRYYIGKEEPIMALNRITAAVAAAALLIAAGSAFGAAQQSPQKIQTTLTADDLQYNINTGDASATGNVVVIRKGSKLTGNSADGNLEKEIMNLRGNVKGDFKENGATLVSDSATWKGDKSKKTDGTVEAFGKVFITRAPNDKLKADYVLWTLGTEDYKAKGNVDGVFENRALIASEATRAGDKFWAKDVKRYEDKIQKFVLSAKFVEGRLVKDKTGQETMDDMIADQNVVFDYVDKQGLKSRVTGDKAVYSKARGTIVVSGNTKAVRSDGKTVTADTMIVHEDTRNIEAKGNSKITFLVNENKKPEEKTKNSGTKATKKTKEEEQKKAPVEKQALSEDKAEKAESPKAPVDNEKRYQLNDKDRSWVEE